MPLCKALLLHLGQKSALESMKVSEISPWKESITDSLVPEVTFFISDVQGPGALATEVLQHMLEVYHGPRSSGTGFYVKTVGALQQLSATYLPLKGACISFHLCYIYI
jgi:hypothetical protein